MTLRMFIVILGVILLAAAPPFAVSTASGQDEHANLEKAKPLAPDRQSERGDYDIEHYKIRQSDLLKIRMRGVYEVVGVEDRHLRLKPLPNQEGLVPGVWKVPAGRSHIGNHHKIVVSALNVKDQTATVALEYKERWHWWDINF